MNGGKGGGRGIGGGYWGSGKSREGFAAGTAVGGKRVKTNVETSPRTALHARNPWNESGAWAFCGRHGARHGIHLGLAPPIGPWPKFQDTLVRSAAPPICTNTRSLERPQVHLCEESLAGYPWSMESGTVSTVRTQYETRGLAFPATSRDPWGVQWRQFGLVHAHWQHFDPIAFLDRFNPFRRQ